MFQNHQLGLIRKGKEGRKAFVVIFFARFQLSISASRISATVSFHLSDDDEKFSLISLIFSVSRISPLCGCPFADQKLNSKPDQTFVIYPHTHTHTRV